ncbi:MAG TPA: hypothetical protein VN520_01800 [Streptomyces sp.]|uniref:LGFP repeat-containing protein n=1 Tax=Streptomyces sp. TaxID=1931 RepID=UPI002BD3CD34|nr:hypothetical protein [Streptomyces sp.]HWU05139.1 hypothetical protein [Streptomyces sp.]
MPEVIGAIREKWLALGGDGGILRQALDDERPTFDGLGRAQEFQAGTVSWHPLTGAFAVWGLIRETWFGMGREQYGYPVTDESGCPDGRGRFNHFRAVHTPGNPEASIYWTPETGAHPVYGDIRRKWSELGWENSPLKYPLAPETDCPTGGGRRQAFEAGTAVWHPAHGTFTTHGLIAATWTNTGSEQFGYPITDETGCPDGRGRYNHFRAMHTPGNPEASIYWTPETGAHPVYGAIRDRWARRGWETSSVGYPVEAEHDRAGLPGREQSFERGRVSWSPATGAFFDPLALSAPIRTGGLAALGGWVAVTVNGDGSTRWQGHAHNSGADGYDFGMSAVLRASSGRALAFAHSGRVGGTFTSGDRDHDWDRTAPPHPIVSANLAAFSDGQLETHLNYTSDIGSGLENAVEWLVKWGVGTALGPVGAVVFVGLEVGSLIATGSLVPGARLAGGILWMAGPANTLLAIAAEGVASLGSRTRELTQEEYDWADGQVFSGSLPARDRIVLTDTIGGGDRAFAFPRYDGKVTLNMGAGAFDDPRRQPGGAYGQTFVHELVHAWQIRHMPMELSLLADAFASKVCEATGGNPYTYGPAGPAYGELNLEQQAQVVSDWFAGRAPAGTNQTGTARDVNSPYFRYINENIRTGAV